jgi:hypothetical protein
VSWADRFQTYFQKPAAVTAAKSLSDGVELELLVAGESLTFTKEGGKNVVRAGAPRKPHVTFTVPAEAAEAILNDPSEDVGQIGVHIAKLIVASEPGKRIGFKLHAGFLTLFTNGYFGVVTAGGGAFASFLASRGLNGINGIKSALKKLRSDG